MGCYGTFMAGLLASCASCPQQQPCRGLKGAADGFEIALEALSFAGSLEHARAAATSPAAARDLPPHPMYDARPVEPKLFFRKEDGFLDQDGRIEKASVLASNEYDVYGVETGNVLSPTCWPDVLHFERGMDRRGKFKHNTSGRHPIDWYRENTLVGALPYVMGDLSKAYDNVSGTDGTIARHLLYALLDKKFVVVDDFMARTRLNGKRLGMEQRNVVRDALRDLRLFGVAKKAIQIHTDLRTGKPVQVTGYALVER